MNLPPLPISPKKAVIAIALLVFIAVNYEELLFFAQDFDPATPTAMEGVAAQPSNAQPPPPLPALPLSVSKIPPRSGTLRIS